MDDIDTIDYDMFGSSGAMTEAMTPAPLITAFVIFILGVTMIIGMAIGTFICKTLMEMQMFSILFTLFCAMTYTLFIQ
jgi:hypothetical protein